MQENNIHHSSTDRDDDRFFDNYAYMEYGIER
ncbi:hypothetical protein BCAL_2343 [Bifidobacterium callitrichos DSM 23973]|uniref:Uncharacterized protein n=1 Tax=Bifidobacterium callitrichos DSM 23973 TaxID=1437609 RepID=A0A087A5S3_9BIFI|nr:hypothetical protein BCAL_2343 [Bifidobacterium callitrichos DSM 23973]